MEHTIEHDLDPATAKKVTDRAFDEYKNRFGNYEPTLHWESDRRAKIGFNAKGIRIDGSIELAEKVIKLNLDVPFLLRPFKKTAIDVIEREVRLWIGKAHAGQL